jgi:nucleoid-associated protein YgaU
MKNNRSLLVFGVVVLITGHGFAQNTDALMKNVRDTFMLYERYLPNSLLAQTRAIRNRVLSKPDEADWVLNTMRGTLERCDTVAYENLLDRLTEIGQKDEKLARFRANSRELENLHQRYLSVNAKARQSLAAVRADTDISAIDTLYNAFDRRYAELVVNPGLIEKSLLVAGGDSLRTIAQRVYGDETRWPDIYDANRSLIRDPNIIYPNMELTLPGLVDEAAGYTFVTLDTTWYVKTGGNDAWDGLSEDSAFATLPRALRAAAESDLKTVTLLGQRFPNTRIDNTGTAEITITGQADAPKAPLLAGVSVSGASSIRFEHLVITAARGAGLSIENASVTLGASARVSGNTTQGGVFVGDQGKLFMLDGAEIVNNASNRPSSSETGGDAGGVFVSGGALVMRGGKIADNSATGVGGGVYVADGSFTMHGGSVSGNTSGEGHGNGVYVSGGSFEVRGGEVSGSVGATGDAIYISRGAQFTRNGGSIAANVIVDENKGAVIASGSTGSTTTTDKTYTVQHGDYLRHIAAVFYDDETQWTRIYQANANRLNLVNPDFITPNMELVLPGLTTSREGPVSIAVSAIVVPGSWYVRAAGNDRSDGRTEAAAFKTLRRALQAASSSDSTKTITVLGTLELNDSDLTQSIDTADIVITGKREAPATLQRSGGEKRLTISDTGNLRFEHITLTGSTAGALGVMGGTVTLGMGATISGNVGTFGAGIYVKGGKLVMLDGAAITNNAVTSSGGAVVLEGGSFTMMGGSITGNSAVLQGGGVSVVDGNFVITGGTISGNISESGKGGGAYVENGSLVMTGNGVITKNRAEYGGGIYVERGSTVLVGGELFDNNGYYGQGLYIADGGSFSQLGGAIKDSVEGEGDIKIAGSDEFQAISEAAYYVRADGSDENDGVSEATPFKTLEKAVQAALRDAKTTVVVIGTVAGATRIQNSGETELVITGKPRASAAEQAVLSGATEQSTVEISGHSNVRFASITIASGKGGGCFMLYDDANLTLGKGAAVRGTPETLWGVRLDKATFIMNENATLTNINTTITSAVDVAQGTFIMTGNALISQNSVRNGSIQLSGQTQPVEMEGNGGAVHIRDGVFTMDGQAKITGNRASDNGGGVCVDKGVFSMRGNAMISDNIVETGLGGGVFVNQHGAFAMQEQARIMKNTTAGRGGGVYVFGAMDMQGAALIANNTAADGGGMVIAGTSAVSLKNDAAIKDNHAVNEAGSLGGGVLGLRSGSRLELRGNAVVSGNTATYGGGIATFGVLLIEQSMTVTGNTALKRGGGVVFLSRDAAPLVPADADMVQALRGIRDNEAPEDADIVLY